MSHALPRPPPCLFSSGLGYSRGMCVSVGSSAMCGNLVIPIGLFSHPRSPQQQPPVAKTCLRKTYFLVHVAVAATGPNAAE